MEMNRNVKVVLTTSMEDWKIIRECYVQSFVRYSLYKYMVPGQSKREEFLRAYLDANYEVTVGSGRGILVAVKLLPSTSDDPNCKDESDTKVIGGVIFVPPSEDGCGWAIGSDEPYWEAYEKYGLARISKEGYERVKRYEAWENRMFTQKASNTRIPLWNGLFCAMSPKYSTQGIGSAFYKDAIRIIGKYSIEKISVNTSQTTSYNSSEKGKSPIQGCEENQCPYKTVNDLTLKQSHPHTLLSHRSQLPLKSKEVEDQISKSKKENSKSRFVDSVKGSMFNASAPLVVAISHSDRAAHFHESNGFCPVVRVPYHDEIEGTTPFFTHVLVLDPFRTGRINEISSALQANDGKLKDENPNAIMDDLAPSNPDRLLVE